MKETKVYVDELPKSCRDCPCMNSNCFCKLYYMQNQNGNVLDCEERDTLRQERDVWKSACELACAFLSKLTQDNICDYEEYFYQQAKMERNDEGD